MNDKNITLKVFICKAFVFALCFGFPLVVMAQGGLEGEISNTIGHMVRIVNILIVGFVVWAGFLIAKGDGTGVSRLIYGVVGLLVVNTAELIITYFR